MRTTRRPFGILVLTIILGQVVVAILQWRSLGWPDARWIHFSAATGSFLIILTGAAIGVRFARAKKPGKGGIGYLQILTISLIGTMTEAVYLTIPTLGKQNGSQESPWTALFAAVAIVAALLVVMAYISAATYISVSDSHTASHVLNFMATWLFWQRLSPGLGTLTSTEGIEEAVPPGYPRDYQGYRQADGATGHLVRWTAWAEQALAGFGTIRRRRWAPAPAMTEAGFVQLRGQRIELAVINYYRPALLLRALSMMPRRVRLAGRDFRVAARPWLQAELCGDVVGDGHCWVKSDKGERHGVVTARRALDRATSDAGDRARTVASRPEISGPISMTSDIMEVALIEVNSQPMEGLVAAPRAEKAV